MLNHAKLYYIVGGDISMILDVKFNTKEKAERCFNLLGIRAIDIFTIKYKEEVYGYFVHYFRRQV